VHKPYGKYRRRREDNIKIDPEEIRYERVDWNRLGQDSDPVADSYGSSTGNSGSLI